MADTLNEFKNKCLRGYRVSIEKISSYEELTYPKEQEYCKTGLDTTGQDTYGYVTNPNTKPTVKTIETKTIIFEQQVEELDIAQVILAVNGLGKSAKDTVTSS